MRTLIAIILLTMTMNAQADTLEVISDSKLASGHHNINLLKSQIQRVLECRQINNDFIDSTPDLTQVLMKLDDVSAPNVTMRGHYPFLISGTVDKALCDKIETMKANWNPNNPIKFSFKLLIGEQRGGQPVLQEQVTVHLPGGIDLQSVQTRALFQ